jgi:hypothetical protein
MTDYKLGSVKNKIVSSDLLEERSKLAFDQQEMKVYLHGGDVPYQKKMYYYDIVDKHPELRNHN